MFSHSHTDHYNPEYHKLASIAERARCIISYDIYEQYGEPEIEYHIVRPGDRVRINGLNITAFDSSDIGVSYVIEADDVRIYFSGDNAYWVREGLSDEINKIIEKKFYSILVKINRSYSRVDIAFTPICMVCEKLGGIEDVAKILKPKLLVPIHLRGNVRILEELRRYLMALTNKVFIYSKAGDHYYFSKKAP